MGTLSRLSCFDNSCPALFGSITGGTNKYSINTKITDTESEGPAHKF